MPQDKCIPTNSTSRVSEEAPVRSNCVGLPRTHAIIVRNKGFGTSIAAIAIQIAYLSPWANLYTYALVVSFIAWYTSARRRARRSAMFFSLLYTSLHMYLLAIPAITAIHEHFKRILWAWWPAACITHRLKVPRADALALSIELFGTLARITNGWFRHAAFIHSMVSIRTGRLRLRLHVRWRTNIGQRVIRL